MNHISEANKDSFYAKTLLNDISLDGRPILKSLSNETIQVSKRSYVPCDPSLDKENLYKSGCPKSSLRAGSNFGCLANPKCVKADTSVLELKNETSRSFSSLSRPCEVTSPKQPVIAFDIVRATFDDLESLFSEMRLSDYPCIEGSFSNMDYFLRIIAHERFREKKTCFQTRDFLARQGHPITSDMLVTLADWMVEIQENFSLSSSSLHLAWSLLYAFFGSPRSIQKTEIQLFASVAFVVACKLEELDSPDIEDFVFLTSSAYSHGQLVIAEQELLTSIDFNLHWPNPFFYLRYFFRLLDSQSVQLDCMCRFLLDVGLHDYEISMARASKRAAAVLWLARRVLRNPSYTLWCKVPQIAKLYSLILSNERYKAFYTSFVGSCGRDGHSSTGCHVALGSPVTLVPPTKSVSESVMPDVELSKGEEREMPEEEKCNFILELHEMEKQRCPLWPPLLRHITGYEEKELIPLALQYHRRALQMLAENARGACLQARSEDTEVETEMEIDLGAEGDVGTAGQTLLRPTCSRSLRRSRTRLTASRRSTERTTSPGGHNIRRHVVSKYCRTCYMGVAETYLRCSFENLVPYFPELQCPDFCDCFVCVNLLSPEPSPLQGVKLWPQPT